MKLIIALGNPGNEYVNTRHNAGFLVAEALQKGKLPKDIVLRKSDVFMNESGSFVRHLISQYPNISIFDLYIIHDDLDIKLGKYKIQLGHSPKDHNGVISVDEELGTSDYWHVKIGIDNRPLDNKPLGIEYVLQNFSDQEKTILDRVINNIVKDLTSTRN